ncbi:MAG: hypothetical protein CVU11_13275 [Bacteroidetes bacterium HGW-Bacteroidetes-6]|jgi:hypothetical protein|nr:MAG: hypothetical protein CVU11_13275 [Bacteroidetes bacterium HGW-Bacteroidetes-6]
MKTIEAFTAMLKTKGIAEKIGVPENTIKSLRFRLKNGVFISIDKMIELLVKAGYSIETEMTWKDNSKK